MLARVDHRLHNRKLRFQRIIFRAHLRIGKLLLQEIVKAIAHAFRPSLYTVCLIPYIVELTRLNRRLLRSLL